MRKWIVGALLLICILCMGACTKPRTDEEMITDRINSFVTCYNNGDLEGAINCMNAKTRNSFKSQLALAEQIGGGLLGFDIDAYSLFGAGIGMTSEDDALEVSNLTLNMISDEKATVDVDMSIKSKSGGFTDKGCFTMVKEDGDWYIQNFEG